MKWLIILFMGLLGAFVGGLVGLEVVGSYVFRAADGSSLPGCGNVGMEPGMLIGLVLGAAAGVWLVKRRSV